jgi:Integrase core domain
MSCFRAVIRVAAGLCGFPVDRQQRQKCPRGLGESRCAGHSIPFSAARARDAGLEHLKAAHPDLRFLQFIDGNCEMDADWLRSALSIIEEQDHVAAVFGRRRERSPESSLYNLVCDLEWDTPIGEAFNSELRSECLNAHWFLSLEDACEKLEAWRRHYNEERPHSTIGNTPPDHADKLSR